MTSSIRSKSGLLTRRGLLAGAAALGAGGPLVSRTARAANPTGPRRGGTLRIGASGGGSTETLDPTQAANTVTIINSFMIYGYIVEYDTGRKILPSVAESWEPRAGATEWVFNIRKGVEFHNGKSLDADDVIYSINRHRGPNNKSLSAGLLAQISDVKADGKYRFIVTLSAANAELPYILGVNHLGVVPKDFNDWLHPIGSGPYVLKSYEPGVQSALERNPNYWKPDSAWVDRVEVTVINDTTARLNALLTGKVDVMNRVDRRTVGMFSSASGVSIVRSPGGWHYTFPMDAGSPDFSDNNVRLALKYGIDREQLLARILQGFGKLGNDHPIPSIDQFYNPNLPQRAYDPDKAKFYLKAAGRSDLKVALSTSPAVFAEAVDAAVLYQQSAQKAGIDIEVVREPADGYFSSVWRKKPFVMSYFSGRPTADTMFSLAWKSDSPSNDSHWKSERFDQLLIQARAELDGERRKQIYWELQKIASDDGACIIPVFADFIDAVRSNVKGFVPDANYELSGLRLPERAWLES
jgi:peptide/nickel transport system substrate-binding protein